MQTESPSGPRAPTILIVDDTHVIHSEVTAILRDEIGDVNVISAYDGGAGFKLLVSESVDLVLLDLVMAGIDGLKFLALRATQPRLGEIPVLLLTASRDDSGSKMRAFEAGASDFIVKPVDDAELAARVKVHLKIKALQDELREKNAHLEALARLDALTQIANRRTFDEVLAREFSRASRHHTPLAHVMVDIDHFKAVNDTHGHAVGDQVLVYVAQALAHDCRPYDLVSRYGGEEFSILLPHTKVEDAVLVAQRYLRLIGDAQIQTSAGPICVTTSMGVAACPPQRFASAADLVRASDAALYCAKAQGRNRVVVAAAEPDVAPVDSPDNSEKTR